MVSVVNMCHRLLFVPTQNSAELRPATISYKPFLGNVTVWLLCTRDVILFQVEF